MNAPVPSLLQNLRGLIFMLIAYPLMLLVALLFLIPAWFSRRAALMAIKTYLPMGFWLLRMICGTRVEVRGTIPTGPCIVASKHQSFLDIWLLSQSLPSPRFVMKRSLLWMPVIGIYGSRIGSVPIDRQARGKAVRDIERGIETGPKDGQTIIYPQGTRIVPGVKAPYKSGVARLYEKFDLPIVMVAANVGCFWPRVGLWRAPGTAVMEFVGTIPPGQTREVVMERVEREIETASDALLAEAWPER